MSRVNKHEHVLRNDISGQTGGVCNSGPVRLLQSGTVPLARGRQGHGRVAAQCSVRHSRVGRDAGVNKPAAPPVV